MENATLGIDEITLKFQTHLQPATYGAVGGLLGVPHRSLMTGRPRNHQNSWIVSKETHLPTGYEPDEIDPVLLDVLKDTPVIETPEELETWLAEMEIVEERERQWDEQIERDAAAGRLDHLVEKALEDHRAGRTKPL